MLAHEVKPRAMYAAVRLCSEAVADRHDSLVGESSGDTKSSEELNKRRLSLRLWEIKRGKSAHVSIVILNRVLIRIVILTQFAVCRER